MAKNHETKVYSGGIRNRINRVTMRTGGASTAHYNSNFTGQGVETSGIYDPAPRSVIERTMRPEELNVQRSRIHEGNPPVMDNDV